jgi:arylsulfatase A-like enzyme
VDLYPTVLSQLGLSVPETVEGRDLFAPGSREYVLAEYGDPVSAITSLKNNATKPVDESILSELSHPLQCVRTQTEKCVRVVGDNDYRYEFTGSSPKERLVETNPSGPLPAILSEQLSGELGVEEQAVDDPALRKNLEDLGYL